MLIGGGLAPPWFFFTVLELGIGARTWGLMVRCSLRQRTNFWVVGCSRKGPAKNRFRSGQARPTANSSRCGLGRSDPTVFGKGRPVVFRKRRSHRTLASLLPSAPKVDPWNPLPCRPWRAEARRSSFFFWSSCGLNAASSGPQTSP